MEIVREERIKERAQEDQALKSADVAKKESYVWKDDEEVRFKYPFSTTQITGYTSRIFAF